MRIDVGVAADLKKVLNQFRDRVEAIDRSAWLSRISDWQEDSSQRDILSNYRGETLLTPQVIRQIWKGNKDSAVIVSDVGQHQMLECQYYDHEKPHTLLSSGGLGTMGFSLPAAIGARFGVPKEEEVWVIVGDGSIQMTITELATAVQEKSNINICIMNNGYLGMVRQWQQLFYDERYAETPISSPDYVKLAEAYGMPGYRVTKFDEVAPVLAKV